MTHAGQSLRLARALTLGAVVTAASISTMELCLGLAILAWLGHLILDRSQGLPDPELLALLGGFVALSLLSATQSADSARAMGSVRAGLLLLAAPLAAAVLGGEGRRVVRAVLLLQAGLLGIWAVAEYALVWDGNPLSRVHGPFNHHMTLAGFLLVTVLQGLPEATLAPLLTGRWGRAAGRASVLLGTAGLVVTLTRSAILALVCGLVVLFLTSITSDRRLWRWALAVVLVLGVAAAVTLPWMMATEAPNPAAGAASIDDRVQLWKAGLRMIRDNPWLGVGAHHTRLSVADYLDPEYFRPGRPAHLHGAWMTLAAERGIPALLILLLLYARSWMRGGMLLVRSVESGMVRGALAALAAFLIMGLFEDNFDDSEVLFVHLMVLAVLWQKMVPRPAPNTS